MELFQRDGSAWLLLSVGSDVFLANPADPDPALSRCSERIPSDRWGIRALAASQECLVLGSFVSQVTPDVDRQMKAPCHGRFPASMASRCSPPGNQMCATLRRWCKPPSGPMASEQHFEVEPFQSGVRFVHAADSGEVVVVGTNGLVLVVNGQSLAFPPVPAVQDRTTRRGLSSS